jgi:[ribosomal protein S18]-alanine N-acetyltransferase
MTSGNQPSRLFRPGRPEDAQAIRSILVGSNLSAPALGDLERATHSPIGEILTFICEQDHEPVGVLQWRHLGEEVEILDLAVRRDHRRRGFASYLLQSFLDHISHSAVRGIFLEVRESNSAAIALYKKFAFEITGRRPNYYRNPEESALLMNLLFQA